MWKSLAVLSGDLVVWLDADVIDFDPAFVTGLLGPLLTEPEVGYVKALYRRGLGADDEGGGRVTEICARPLINLFYPELAGFAQPLSGEAAGRRDLLCSVPFFSGYAVEIGPRSTSAAARGWARWRRWTSVRGATPTSRRRRSARWRSPSRRPCCKRVAQDGRAPDGLAGAGAYVRPVREGSAYVLAALQTRPDERPPMTDVLHASIA